MFEKPTVPLTRNMDIEETSEQAHAQTCHWLE